MSLEIQLKPTSSIPHQAEQSVRPRRSADVSDGAGARPSCPESSRPEGHCGAPPAFGEASRQSSSVASAHYGQGAALPLVIHHDDIIRGRVDIAAVRRREEANRKRLIDAGQKPYFPKPQCDHRDAVKSYVFTDRKVLRLYSCGCSNGAEILNGRRNGQ